MGKIFYIMGKSSTGKDSIFLELLKKTDLNLKNVVTYTTRPIRQNEIDGREYFFCTKEKKEQLLQEEKIIELRTYHTVHGDWDYFTVDDGQIDLKEHNVLMIGTLASYLKMREYFSKNSILPIYIEVEDGVRLMRAVERERRQATPKYEELCRRFLADQEDFSESMLHDAGITVRFNNNKKAQTVEEIYAYIKEEID